jgi:hypothetical protein
MTTVLLIPGGKSVDEKPIARFLLSLNAAIDYYLSNKSKDNIIFLVSGRWVSVTETFSITEAEIGKRFIHESIPNAEVVKEDISVELIGNYAFSKPLICGLKPDKVIVFTSELLHKRSILIAKRIFADSFPYEIQIITNAQSDNAILVDKEKQAMKLFRKLFINALDGDDAAFREILLYSTPYYFKGVIDDKSFFDAYWGGGFDNFINGINERRKK